MHISPKSKVLLSIFVIAGLGIFTFVIFYIGQNRNLFSSTITLKSIFQNVSGLQVGNNVRFGGIKVGSVSDIEILNDTAIKVEVVVEKKYQKFLRKDSKMAIGSEGLMGDKLVDINSGTFSMQNPIDNEMLQSVKPIDMDAIMASAQNTLSNIESLSTDISQIAGKINHSKGIFYTLTEDHQAAVMLKNTLGNLESATDKMADNLEAAKHSILFRGFFKKKERKKAEREAQELQEKEDRKNGIKTDKEKEDKKGFNLFKKKKADKESEEKSK